MTVASSDPAPYVAGDRPAGRAPGAAAPQAVVVGAVSGVR